MSLEALRISSQDDPEKVHSGDSINTTPSLSTAIAIRQY